MKIKSTDISNKSTDGSNFSTEGSNQSVKHDDGNPHPMNAMRPPAESIGSNDGKEWNGEVNAPGIERRTGGGSVNSDAAHEAMCKHPDKEYDPECRCK
jgi:hypothetical protein